MTLHLVRLPVDLGALAAFAVANRASDDDGGYALHLALRRRFGTAGPQPFRLFADGPAAPHLLGYARDAEELRELAALPATDDALDPVFGAVQLRAMPDTWREGARYSFEVRVRPVVRYGRTRREARAATDDAWQKRAGEVDAFVAACERAGDREVPVSREAVYGEWLAKRLDPAAGIEASELRTLRRVRTRRSGHGRGGRVPVEGPDAVLAGTLAGRDPAAFAHALARGVGRHAAFGFGMLLLSAPRKGD